VASAGPCVHVSLVETPLNRCVVVLVETDSDSEDGAADPWINRRQPVIYCKKHSAEHHQVLRASPASDDHESLLHSDHLEKCTYSRLV